VSPPWGKRWVSAVQYPRAWRACAHQGWTSYSKARIRIINIVMFLHRIFMLVAGAMIALSILFVFRPHRPSTGIQPPHQLAVHDVRSFSRSCRDTSGTWLRETMTALAEVGSSKRGGRTLAICQ
jgi:hypothetical protein